MDGSIELASTPNKGTTATIKIPVSIVKETQTANGVQGEAIVIGDDSDLVTSITATCTQLGFSTSSYKSIDECVSPSDDCLIITPALTGGIITEKHRDCRILTYACTAEDQAGSDIRFPIDSERLQELLHNKEHQPGHSRRFEGMSGSKLRALVAEDVAINQRIAQENLRSLGVDAVVVANGVDAVETYKKNTFDLIFMDCHMPVLDGYTAARLMREHERSTARNRTPIIALTAGKGSGDEEDCLQAGMDDILLKPFALDQLRESIARHVGTLQASEANADAHNLTPRSKSAKRALTDTPDIDTDVLRNFKELAPGDTDSFLYQLAEGFERQLNLKLTEVFNKHNSTSIEKLRADLHAMKSMSMNMGAKKLTSVLVGLENSAKAGSVSLGPDDESVIREHLNDYLKALQSFTNT
jgi:CheY-like chemotaxis protein